MILRETAFAGTSCRLLGPIFGKVANSVATVNDRSMINYLSDLTKTNTNNTDEFCKNPAQGYQSLLKIHKCGF